MNKLLILSIFLVLVGLFLIIILQPQEETFMELYACQEINCADLLIELIDSSDDFVCAFYDLGESKVLSALEKGEVLVYKENYEKYYSENFVSVSSKGLMHHKFCVFDKKIVLTGTWNPTNRGTYENDNVVLLVGSSKVAKYFLKEYRRLLGKSYSVGSKEFEVENSSVDVVFCRVGDCEGKVIEEIKSAKESVRVLAFSFTSVPVADSLVSVEEGGINVTVLMEKSRRGAYSVDEYLVERGVNVFFDGNTATMHEKVFIIDNKTVILGSYNPTKNANERNDENLVIVRSEEIVKNSLNEFNRILAKSVRFVS